MFSSQCPGKASSPAPNLPRAPGPLPRLWSLLGHITRLPCELGSACHALSAGPKSVRCLSWVHLLAALLIWTSGRTILSLAGPCVVAGQPGREGQGRANGVQAPAFDVWGFWWSVGVGSDAQAWQGRGCGCQGALSGLARVPLCRCAVLHLGCRGPLAAWPALWVGAQQLHLHRHHGSSAQVLQCRC